MDEVLENFHRVRERTLALAAPLSAEDQCVQAMPDASPTKWHLGHTSWFFEELVLRRAPFDPRFALLFNSYYESLGPRVERGRRGMLTRPALAEVHAYRAHVDGAIAALLAEGTLDGEARARLELGLHHEQQHQELLLTDIALVLATQPLRPAYRSDLPRDKVGEGAPRRLAFLPFAGGLVHAGAGTSGFAFDNERPRHRVFLEPFALASRPIVNAEVSAFIADRGYTTAGLWLSDGWTCVQREGWRAPLYWSGEGTLWDLAGEREVDPAEIACHLSFYEADAIARWLGGRFPTEVEWEVAVTTAGGDPTVGNFADDGRLQPVRAANNDKLQHAFGDVWEWTSSSYAPYPGFRPLPGALGEYNGKFMSGQQVLRGGSCLTPRGHARATYRNFFPPAARWQMAGARIARDAA